MPELGVAGTHYIEGDFHSFRDSYINVHHVNGQIQLFRRKCFEDIGGYVPIKGGGIDWVAVTTARMKGWLTYSFSERVFHHHRKMGTAESNELKSRFHYGKKDYFLGGHPLWQLFRSTFQLAKKPYVLGGVCLFSGYMWCWLTRHERPVSPELMKFHRKEQLDRLRKLLPGPSGLGPLGHSFTCYTAHLGTRSETTTHSRPLRESRRPDCCFSGTTLFRLLRRSDAQNADRVFGN